MTCLVFNAVQLEVKVDERLVHFQGLAEVARALIVDAIVAKVEVSQDLRLE